MRRIEIEKKRNENYLKEGRKKGNRELEELKEKDREKKREENDQ